MKSYPDVSVLLAMKDARRKKLANLPVEEKLKIATRLRLIAQNAPSMRKRGEEAEASPTAEPAEE